MPGTISRRVAGGLSPMSPPKGFQQTQLRCTIDLRYCRTACSSPPIPL